jgi:hypothetical protein
VDAVGVQNLKMVVSRDWESQVDPGNAGFGARDPQPADKNRHPLQVSKIIRIESELSKSSATD